jgi:hypothetical protein
MDLPKPPGGLVITQVPPAPDPTGRRLLYKDFGMSAARSAEETVLFLTPNVTPLRVARATPPSQTFFGSIRDGEATDLLSSST